MNTRFVRLLRCFGGSGGGAADGARRKGQGGDAARKGTLGVAAFAAHELAGVAVGSGGHGAALGALDLDRHGTTPA